jgi:hypothetical protein
MEDAWQIRRNGPDIRTFRRRECPLRSSVADKETPRPFPTGAQIRMGAK